MYAFINSLIRDLTSEDPFADLIIRALCASNPLRVWTTYVRRLHVQAKKEPAREVKDWGKELFVFPNISYLFSAGTKVIYILHYAFWIVII